MIISDGLIYRPLFAVLLEFSIDDDDEREGQHEEKHLPSDPAIDCDCDSKMKK
jgi:hypothetical protein